MHKTVLTEVWHHQRSYAVKGIDLTNITCFYFGIENEKQINSSFNISVIHVYVCIVHYFLKEKEKKARRGKTKGGGGREETERDKKEEEGERKGERENVKHFKRRQVYFR